MGLRKQTIFLSIISTLASPWVAALGLGEIKLKSTLNQPLNAEIQLTQTKDLSDREILVGLASQADFARVGVDKPFFLGDLKFQVMMDPGKGPYVRITSSKPVVEPYLNFIVQAQWPSGKLLREYTVLVDLPVYGGDTADSVAPAVSRSTVNTPKVETQISQAPESPTARVNRPSSSAQRPKTPAPAPVVDEKPFEAKPSGDTYGPVASNDTLWKIARASKPNGASIQQTMLAIQQLNPDAFINGNINLLRKGETLRLPASDAATQVAADEAARKVAATMPTRKSAGEESAGPQIDASKTVSKTEAKAATVEGRVKLSSSNSAEGSKSGRGAGADKGSKEALSNELTITKEELDAKSRETADLNARLKAVDEQIENTEKLIQVNSEEMHKLELAIEKNKQIPGVPNNTAAATPTETPVASNPEIPAAIGPDGKPLTNVVPPAVTEAPNGAAVADPATESTQTPPAQTPPSAEVKPAQAPAPKVNKPAPEPKGLVDLLMDNILYVGAGLAIVLGLALVLLKRRRSNDDGPEPWVGASDTTSTAWDADFSLPSFDDDKTTLKSDSDDTTQFQIPASSQSVKLETDDVVSESDIHIALNDFDTAEKLLLSSLEQDPANSRVLLKLLEVYSRRQDLNSFDRQYAKLRHFCDEDSNARAEQLRGYIDNAPPFDEHKYSDEAFIAAVNGKVKSDDADVTQIPLGAIAAGASGALAAASFEAEPFAAFEFDDALDETQLKELPVETATNEFIGETEESFSLDFEEPAPSSAPAGDRKSLAELLAGEEGEEGLDLSDFDGLSFGKGDEPVTSLDDPSDFSASDMPDLDFSLDDDGLDETDFELDEDALAGEFESNEVEELRLDASLDAGFDDLDEPVAPAPASEPEDDFADLDLSALDYDLPEQEPSTLDDENELKFESSDIADNLLSEDFNYSPRDTEQAISGAIAELDGLTDDLSELDGESFSADLASLESDTEEPLIAKSETQKRQELEALLDFESSFEDLDTTLSDDDLAEIDEPSTPTLVMSAIKDSDLPAADLDFDELDADLGALAADFDGDFSDLDELDAPAMAGVSSSLMDEPVTQFGELDDVDPADILGDGPKERAPIDLEGFDDTVTFAIEDPHTELDELEADLPEISDEKSDSNDRLAAADHNLRLVDILDGSEELVEFEDLDSLDDLAELDLLGDDASALDLDDDELSIPQISAAAPEIEFKLPDFDPESDDDSDLGALCDGDELDTKLDLLRAFVDMGDEDSARHTLEEILEEGTEEQRKQANSLMARIS